MDCRDELMKCSIMLNIVLVAVIVILSHWILSLCCLMKRVNKWTWSVIDDMLLINSGVKFMQGSIKYCHMHKNTVCLHSLKIDLDGLLKR